MRGTDRVVVRDGETISQPAGAYGRDRHLTTWREARTAKEVRVTANRLANFDDANCAVALRRLLATPAWSVPRRFWVMRRGSSALCR